MRGRRKRLWSCARSSLHLVSSSQLNMSDCVTLGAEPLNVQRLGMVVVMGLDSPHSVIPIIAAHAAFTCIRASQVPIAQCLTNRVLNPDHRGGSAARIRLTTNPLKFAFSGTVFVSVLGVTRDPFRIPFANARTTHNLALSELTHLAAPWAGMQIDRLRFGRHTGSVDTNPRQVPRRQAGCNSIFQLLPGPGPVPGPVPVPGPGPGPDILH